MHVPERTTQHASWDAFTGKEVGDSPGQVNGQVRTEEPSRNGMLRQESGERTGGVGGGTGGGTGTRGRTTSLTCPDASPPLGT